MALNTHTHNELIHEPTYSFKGNDYLAVGIAEGFEPAESEEQVLAAWQHLIDTGQCWTLQGWFGRTAQALIESGQCHAKISTCCICGSTDTWNDTKFCYDHAKEHYT